MFFYPKKLYLIFVTRFLFIVTYNLLPFNFINKAKKEFHQKCQKSLKINICLKHYPLSQKSKY